ncbi:MAG: hypothetical protein QME52_04160 [Bacteroidota bacterium]|nr:hypothetical protein [Bacteroidota bacterium]
MNVLIHISFFKLKSLYKISTEWKASNIIKNIASLIVFCGFAIGAYYSTRIATDYLIDTAKLGLFLLHRFLSMLLFVYFISINVGNIIVSYVTFYRSPEMYYYLTKPLSHRNLFIIKFLDNFFYSSTMFFLIALAVLLGYGSHFDMPWIFYLHTMFFMLLPFMLIAGCLAVITLLFVMRFADVLGVWKIILILVLIYLGSLFGYFSLTSPVRLVSAVMQHYPHVDQYFGYLDPAIAKYLPNYWIAESLYWMMKGESSFALSYTILLNIATIFIFIIMVVVGEKLFYPSWIASLSLHGKQSFKLPVFKIFSLLKPPVLEKQTSVLLKKEILQFLREPSQWIHFGIISILIFTFIVSVANINLKQNLPFLQTVSYMVLLLFNAFLIASIALRFVYPSVSIEGSNLWQVLTAPISRSKIYWLKFIIAITPILLISEILVIFSHRSLWEYPILIQSASIIMMGVAIAMVGLNFGAGSFFSDFREKNPIRIASSQSATVTFLVSLFYLSIIVALTFYPFMNYFQYILRGESFNKSLLLYGMTSVFALSIVLGVISIWIGFRAFKRDYI